MPTCPECNALVSEVATVCPACARDLRPRRLATPVAERDEERAKDDLLAAALATDEAHAPRPPWVAPLEQRMAPPPSPPATAKSAPAERPEEADVVPAPPRRRRFWSRRSG